MITLKKNFFLDIVVNNSFVFDFDSTIITRESFDEIIFLAIDDDPLRKKRIEELTNAGMNGEADFSESLRERVESADILQKHIDSFSTLVPRHITPGIPEIVRLLFQRGEKVFILSGGFLETIFPVADVLGIPHENCFGNTFLKNKFEKITGIDFSNPLSESQGKAKTIAQKKEEGIMTGKVICIGDGISDAKPYISGAADEFWGFFQNVDSKNREKVCEKASRIFSNSEKLLLFLQNSFFSEQNPTFS